MNELIPLVIPFIALICFINMVENFVEWVDRIYRKINKKGKHMGIVVAFFIIVSLSYLIAMLGNFRFFNYLDVYFTPHWLDWLMSAAVIGSGTGAMERKFSLMKKIPSVVSGVKSAFRPGAREETVAEQPTSYLERVTMEEDIEEMSQKKKHISDEIPSNNQPTI